MLERRNTNQRIEDETHALNSVSNWFGYTNQGQTPNIGRLITQMQENVSTHIINIPLSIRFTNLSKNGNI